ncbi:MAG: hydroxyacylglutathione hydrolase [Zetaproteobacteria bacterium]|nr:hydroxyacylglutathione hydrolase [Zetaproteobacteria bacterium]
MSFCYGPVHQITAFTDNYLYLVALSDPTQVIAVDPGDGGVIAEYLSENQLQLRAIWNTHHHPDHTGGNKQLVDQFGCEVYGPAAERGSIPCISHLLSDGDVISIGGVEAQVIATPGHTLGSICYYLPALDILFCGDTLFVMGCGRLFEGTPEQMWNSLCKIAELPEQTSIFCAHEYTLANADFALHAEPENKALQMRCAEVQALRSQQKPTVPTTVALEKSTNPFVRAAAGHFVESYQCHNGLETFTALRGAKDQF